MKQFAIRRIIGSLSLASLLFLPVSPAAATGSGVPAVDATALKKYAVTDLQGHWAQDTLTDFVQADIINGYPETDGTFAVRP